MALFCMLAERVKQQRLVLSSALIVALVLILLGQAPIIPILVGCLAVIVWSFVRSPR
jgi:hypothetical protein